MFSEDLSLLSTDYIPSPYELYLINARIREQHQELRSIDIKITSLAQQLDDLRYHRACLDRSYAVAQSLVAPIRRLPLEILQDIFAQSIPQFRLDSLESDTSEDPLDPREPHPHDVRLALRSVCRRWRDVVDATPSVWSTVALDHRLPDDTRVLERWLSHSETELIDVYMHPSAWAESLDAGRFQAVLSLVREHLPHTRLLIAHLRHYRALVDLSLTLTDIFPMNQCTEAPNLEVFGIIGDLDADPHEIVGTIRAPRLTSLILLDSEMTIRSFTHDSLLSLQRLTMSLSMSASASYLDVLAQCSNLRRLHWTDYSDRQQHSIGPLDGSVSQAPPLLPLLTSLTLRVEVSPETLPLFRHLRGSILDCLSVDASPATDNRPPALDALISLLHDSEDLAHLRQLMLTRASAGPDMSSLFARLPNLTTLHMSACHLEASFFSTLVRGQEAPTSSSESESESLAPGPGCCPRLETLRVYSSHFSVFDLAVFLRHRVESNNVEPTSSSSSNSSAGCCLTCVEIVGCYDMLWEEEREEVLLLQNDYDHIMTIS